MPPPPRTPPPERRLGGPPAKPHPPQPAPSAPVPARKLPPSGAHSATAGRRGRRVHAGRDRSQTAYLGLLSPGSPSPLKSLQPEIGDSSFHVFILPFTHSLVSPSVRPSVLPSLPSIHPATYPSFLPSIITPIHSHTLSSLHTHSLVYHSFLSAFIKCRLYTQHWDVVTDIFALKMRGMRQNRGQARLSGKKRDGKAGSLVRLR